MAIEGAEDAPATLAYSVRALLGLPDLVASIVAELDRAARGLLAQWLPEALMFGTSSAGLAAVRAAALRRAPNLGVPGAFLANLAERAVKVRELQKDQLSAEVRAAGLAKVITSAYGRNHLAVLIRAGNGLPAGGLDQIAAAGQWLAHHGGVGVWLTGAAWQTVTHVMAVDVPLPKNLIAEDADEEPPAAYPALRGMPRWNSPAEQTLERALVDKPWAAGRRWNEPYQSHPLTNPISIDLLWHDARCAVEIDGPEHRLALRFEADRRRDVQLQLDGFAVLRFTTTQIDHDVGAVVSQIEQFLTARRGKPER